MKKATKEDIDRREARKNDILYELKQRASWLGEDASNEDIEAFIREGAEKLDELDEEFFNEFTVREDSE